jgi:hypothetical protein
MTTLFEPQSGRQSGETRPNYTKIDVSHPCMVCPARGLRAGLANLFTYASINGQRTILAIDLSGMGSQLGRCRAS